MSQPTIKRFKLEAGKVRQHEQNSKFKGASANKAEDFKILE